MSPPDDPKGQGFSVVSINATAWNSVKPVIAESRHDIFLIQEHRMICLERIASQQRWLGSVGMHGIFTPVVPGPSGGPSGGTAVIVRSHIWLATPSQDATPGQRFTAALVTIPGCNPFIAVSYYGPPVPTQEDHLTSLASLGEFVLDRPTEVMVGGDFNLTPTQIKEVEWDIQVRMHVLEPPPGSKTCLTPNSASVIDFFTLSPGLASISSPLSVDTSGRVATHNPVSLVFPPPTHKYKIKALKIPRKIPTVVPIGPRNRPARCGTVCRKFQVALEHGHCDTGRRVLSGAWKSCAALLDREVADVFHDVPGNRGKPPVTFRSPIPAPRKDQKHYLLTLAREQMCRWRSAKQLVDQAALLVPSSSEDEVIDVAVRAQALIQHPCPDYSLAAVAIPLLDLLARARPNPTPALLPECDYEMLKSFIEKCYATAAQRVRSQRRHDWEEWMHKSLSNGGKAMHRLARVPPAVALPREQEASHPIAEMQCAATKLSETWKAASCVQNIPSMDADAAVILPAMPRLSVDEIRAAALTFAHATSSSFDGFHPRHFAHLDEEHITMLSLLLASVESVGSFPPPLCPSQYVFLPKPKGGHRAIALFTAIVRLWTRARKMQLDNWASIFVNPPWFAFAGGRGAVDTVWKQSLFTEARRDSDASAAVLVDLASFFDTISLDRLWSEAKALMFPMTLARVSLNLYRARRMFRGLGGGVG